MICYTNFFHWFFTVWAIEKEILIDIKLKKIIDSEFEIGETILWIGYRPNDFIIWQ